MSLILLLQLEISSLKCKENILHLFLKFLQLKIGFVHMHKAIVAYYKFGRFSSSISLSTRDKSTSLSLVSLLSPWRESTRVASSTDCQLNITIIDASARLHRLTTTLETKEFSGQKTLWCQVILHNHLFSKLIQPTRLYKNPSKHVLSNLYPIKYFCHIVKYNPHSCSSEINENLHPDPRSSSDFSDLTICLLDLIYLVK